MRVLRIRAIPIPHGPVMAKPGAPSPAPPGGGGGGDDGAGDEAPAAAEEPAADVEGAGGSFAGVPLWQWIAMGVAFFWARKG
jgi:hypothetical protein